MAAGGQTRGSAAAASTVRVLDLRDSPWVDGPGRTILDTAAGIAAPYRIVVGTFAHAARSDHAYLEEAMRRGLATCPIVERRAFDPAVLRQIVRWCQDHTVDLLHTHDFRSDLYGLAAARWLRIPVVATCHGWIANDRKGRLYTAIDKRLLRFFDRVIVVSERMREQLCGRGVAAEHIAVVPNALVAERYIPDRADRSILAQWGIPPDRKVVGKIGRLSPEKCQDLFLRAAAQVLDDEPNTSFVLIGIGPDEARLRRLADELGIARHVVFAGYRADMPAVYNALDLVVQSSSTEGMPNVILEALSMRVPVVATDVGGTAEIVDDGQSGWLVRPNDSGALVAGIRAALADPARARAMAEAGERRVRTAFGHATRLEQIASVYDEALRRGARSR